MRKLRVSQNHFFMKKWSLVGLVTWTAFFGIRNTNACFTSKGSIWASKKTSRSLLKFQNWQMKTCKFFMTMCDALILFMGSLQKYLFCIERMCKNVDFCWSAMCNFDFQRKILVKHRISMWNPKKFLNFIEKHVFWLRLDLKINDFFPKKKIGRLEFSKKNNEKHGFSLDFFWNS